MAVWFAAGDHFLRERGAYYAIAKDITIRKYPRWLDDADLDSPSAEEGRTVGDLMASAESPPMRDWRARRLRRHRLFFRSYSDGDEVGDYVHFDGERWRRFVVRVARFLAFVDRRGVPARTSAPTYSTYRVHTGYDEPACGLRSIAEAKRVAVKRYTRPAQFNEFINEDDPAQLVAFEPLPDELGSDSEYLAFVRPGDGFVQRRAIGVVEEERRCACCRSVVDVRTVIYDKERDDC